MTMVAAGVTAQGTIAHNDKPNDMPVRSSPDPAPSSSNDKPNDGPCLTYPRHPQRLPCLGPSDPNDKPNDVPCRSLPQRDSPMPPHFTAQIDPFPTEAELDQLHELCGAGIGNNPDKLGAVKRHTMGTATTADKLLVIALTRQLRLLEEGERPDKLLSPKLKQARDYKPADWWIPAGVTDDAGSGRVD